MKSDDTNTYTMSYYEENELFWGPAYLYLGEIFKNGPKKGCQPQILLGLFLSILYYLKVNHQSKLVSCNNKNQSSGNKKDSNAWSTFNLSLVYFFVH